jgi:hypothetical protein
LGDILIAGFVSGGVAALAEVKPAARITVSASKPILKSLVSREGFIMRFSFRSVDE